MDINWQTVAPKLSSVATQTAFVSAVTGGLLAQFKFFLLKEEDVCGRVNFAKKILTSKVASAHRRILASYKYELEGNAVDANAFADKDVVEIHSSEVLRAASLGAQFEKCEVENKRHYDCFFLATIIGGVLIFLALLLSDEIRPFITLAALALMLWQACLVWRNRSLADRLRKYEQSQ